MGGASLDGVGFGSSRGEAGEEEAGTGRCGWTGAVVVVVVVAVAVVARSVVGCPSSRRTAGWVPGSRSTSVM